nr:MGMT family protein [Helcobacillus sp. ACRRO]
MILRLTETLAECEAVTYGDLGEVTGLGPREVGRIMAQYGSAVPWWRVTNARGELPPHLLERARQLWAAEGMPVTADGCRLRLGAVRVPLADLAARFAPVGRDLAEQDPPSTVEP